jgi:organic radical activating enzyme
MSNSTANMVEIFSSIQGEGMLVGLRQVFLRFHGCTMKCHYCDTRSTNTSTIPEFCQVEKTPGRQDFFSMRNPVSLENIKDILEEWVCLVPHAHHSMSLTGGEPLLHQEFLKRYLPELRKILPIYLETNGVLYTELSKCVGLLDHISMDFKLPSTTKCRPFWNEHQKFLEIAAQSNVYVKVVVSQETPETEIRKSCEIIASINKNIPLILQPLSAITGNETISPLSLFELQELASNLIKEVRIIPQTHKFLQLR